MKNLYTVIKGKTYRVRNNIKETIVDDICRMSGDDTLRSIIQNSDVTVTFPTPFSIEAKKPNWLGGF
jgi:hypothetical protein